MSITLKTHKMLWGRAANRCAICRIELVMDASESDDESLVGEACHIVGQSVDGPRGVSVLTSLQRDKYANLILLCNVHHKQVDDQEATFTAERLKETKAEHEQWVRSQLGFDSQKQRDDEVYADYVEHWANAIQLDHWKAWSSAVLSHGQPSLSTEMKDSLETIRPWLLSRVMPGRYPELEASLTNFRFVAQDFCTLFGKHAEQVTPDEWQINKFYRIDDWDEEKYSRLLDKYESYVALVEDLILELTRAANFVCDMVRKHLIPSFRIHEGVALVQAGPYSDFSFKTYRVEYQPSERSHRPYPGLTDFKKERFNRDVCFGNAEDEI